MNYALTKGPRSHWRRAAFAFSLTAIALLTGLGTAAQAQQELREQANKNTIGVISGSVKGTYVRIAAELASQLDQDNELRVVAMLGKGSIQNMTDLLWLKGVDMAIVQSDVLGVIDRDGMAGVQNIHNVVRYVTKLYDEEVHLIVNKSVTKTADLAGTKISIGGRGSGTSMTSLLLLDTLNIEADTVNMSFGETISALKKGDVAAGIVVAGKPASIVADVQNDDELHFLPVELTPDLENRGYLTGTLTSKDYPNLIGEDEGSIDTISVGAILAVYNWKSDHDKHRRLSVFSERFLDELDYIKENTTEHGGPYHPKWAQVDPSVKVPAWTQFEPITRLLEQ